MYHSLVTQQTIKKPSIAQSGNSRVVHCLPPRALFCPYVTFPSKSSTGTFMSGSTWAIVQFKCSSISPSNYREKKEKKSYSTLMVQDFSQTSALNSHIQVVLTGPVHRKQFGLGHQRLAHFFSQMDYTSSFPISVCFTLPRNLYFTQHPTQVSGATLF